MYREHELYQSGDEIGEGWEKKLYVDDREQFLTSHQICCANDKAQDEKLTLLLYGHQTMW